MSEPEAFKAELVEPPRRLVGGRFSLYATHDERLVIAFRIEGDDEDRRLVVPRPLARLAARQAGVNVRTMMTELVADGAEED